MGGAFPLILLERAWRPGMEGFQATAAIRALERTTGVHHPIIAMTAHAMPGDRERTLQAGMDDYVSKPVSRGSLIEAIARQTTVTSGTSH